ncbi:MAG: hypothetical protein M3Q43_10020, partial [Actinomycetota bacterium]|nr:hypothetical protein [Actinomycetota bacterium]
MAAHAKRIEVVAEDRPVLERWAGARATERRLVDRAQIVLLAGEDFVKTTWNLWRYYWVPKLRMKGILRLTLFNDI